MYFVQINKVSNTEHDSYQRSKRYVVQPIVKTVSAKINHAGNQMYDPTNITEQPQ